MVYSYVAIGTYTSTKKLANLILSKDKVAYYSPETSDNSVSVSVKATRNHTAREKTKLNFVPDVIIPHNNILVLEECRYLHSAENFSSLTSATFFFPKPRDPPLA